MKIKKKALSLIALPCLLATSFVVSSQSYYVVMPVKGLVTQEQAANNTSCKAILNSGKSIGNGVYQIRPNSGSAIDVYCDMTTSGGGWTMVVAQFEVDPVTNWNEGVQIDYDPTLASSKGFSLNTSEIPGHTQTAFGKALDPTFVGYSDFTYSTDNITKNEIINLKTSDSHHIDRNNQHYYNRHNPENTPNNLDIWNNTLTYDKTGGDMFSWSFSPNRDLRSGKGFGMNGPARTINDSFAWTVWVR